MFQTQKRPSGYPTYLVMCTNCWKEFPMIKYDLWKTEFCTTCANRLREWIKRGQKARDRLWIKKTPFYRKRSNIKWRCEYSCVNWYKNYGGRGIKCDRESFSDFFNDMYDSYVEFVKKHWIEDTTIDRIDVNGNYNKQNCRWLTMKEQQSGKRNNHKVIYRGREYPTMKWLCELLWKNYHTVFRRINDYWWSVEDAIEK